MPYNPTTDLVGLWRTAPGGVTKAELPGLDFVVQAMSRAGLMRTVTSATAPTANQSTTAWFRPASPSYGSEGALFLWDPTLSMYVPATPELFHGGSSGGDGGGGSGMVIISGTAPSNPTAGTEWWNGTILQLWDGGMWKTVGPSTGSVTTSTLVFAIPQTSTLTLANALPAWSVVPFVATPQVDTMTGWDPITHKYTPKKPGYYAVSIRAYLPTSSGIAILKNDDGAYSNNDQTDIIVTLSATAAAGWQQATGFVQLNGTTDYVRYWAISSNNTLQALTSDPAFSVLALP